MSPETMPQPSAHFDPDTVDYDSIITQDDAPMDSVYCEIQQRLPWARVSKQNAVVLGAGPVGLLGAMALATAGFNTYVYSRSSQPLGPLVEGAGRSHRRPSARRQVDEPGPGVHRVWSPDDVPALLHVVHDLIADAKSLRRTPCLTYPLHFARHC